MAVLIVGSIPGIRPRPSLDGLNGRRQSPASPTRARAPLLQTEVRANRLRNDSDNGSPGGAVGSSPDNRPSPPSVKTHKPDASLKKPVFRTSMEKLFDVPTVKPKRSSLGLRSSLASNICTTPSPSPPSEIRGSEAQTLEYGTEKLDKFGIVVGKDENGRTYFRFPDKSIITVQAETPTPTPSEDGQSPLSSSIRKTSERIDKIKETMQAIKAEFANIDPDEMPATITPAPSDGSSAANMTEPNDATATAQTDEVISLLFRPAKAELDAVEVSAPEPAPPSPPEQPKTPSTQSPLRAHAPTFTPGGQAQVKSPAEDVAQPVTQQSPAQPVYDPTFGGLLPSDTGAGTHERLMRPEDVFHHSYAMCRPPLPVDWMNMQHQQDWARIIALPMSQYLQPFPSPYPAILEPQPLSEGRTSEESLPSTFITPYSGYNGNLLQNNPFLLPTFTSRPVPAPWRFVPSQGIPASWYSMSTQQNTPARYRDHEWREVNQVANDPSRFHTWSPRTTKGTIKHGLGARARFNQPGKKAGFYRERRGSETEEFTGETPCLHCREDPATCGCIHKNVTEQKCLNCGSGSHFVEECHAPALTKRLTRDKPVDALNKYARSLHFRKLKLPVELDYEDLLAQYRSLSEIDPEYQSLDGTQRDPIYGCKKLEPHTHSVTDLLRILDYIINWVGPSSEDERSAWRGFWAAKFSTCPEYWVLRNVQDPGTIYFVIKPMGPRENYEFIPMNVPPEWGWRRRSGGLQNDWQVV